MRTGLEIVPLLALPQDIVAGLDAVYGKGHVKSVITEQAHQIQLLANWLTSDETAPAEVKRDGSSLARSNAAFAIGMRECLAADPGNVFFSPFGAFAALAMAYAGARGRTAEQMAAALRLDLPPERIPAAFRRLVDYLHVIGSGKGCYLEIATALWGQRGAKFRAEYLEAARRCYGAAFDELDFKASDAARERINRWISDKTQGRITNLVNELHPDSRLVLANTVYFKGRWAAPFEKESTKVLRFHPAPGKAVLSPFMRRRDDIEFHEGDGFRAVSLPYDGAMSMAVLLPNEFDGLSRLENSLSAEELDFCFSNFRPRDVVLSLPRFRFETRFDLSARLVSLGMTAAFDKKEADFSGMNGKKAPDDDALRLSQCIQQSFIDVNEEGTEAASATAAIDTVVGASAAQPPPPIEFRADHPFLFVIRDDRTGIIVFLGRLSLPPEHREESAEQYRPPERTQLWAGLEDVDMMLNALVANALSSGSAEILIDLDPETEAALVRFRVAGVLKPGPFQVPWRSRGALAVWIKIMTETMNISERLKPQTGVIKWRGLGKSAKLDVRTLPGPGGESFQIAVRP